MDSSHIKLYGIFSQEHEVTLGTGVTKRKSLSKTSWFAKEISGGMVEMRSLDINFHIQGAFTVLDKEAVLDGFTPEPQLTYKLLSSPLMKGDSYREQGNHASAVREYEKVRNIDDANIRALFGMGISLLALGRSEKAHYVFNDLIKLDEAFLEEHKHLFNELGISLRRQGLINETLRYYFKAQEMTSMDENLQFNIARAYFEGDDLDNAISHLLNALEINNLFESGIQFAKYIMEKQLLEESDSRYKLFLSYLHNPGPDN